MSETNLITRHVGGAKITLPVDEAFEAWFKQQFGQSIKLGRDLPRLGEVWPGEGGVFVGIDPTEDGSRNWLIAAPQSVGYFEDLTYGEYGKDVPGAASWHDGRANTQALLATGGDYPAAKKCVEIEHEGHRDYFLGAKLQLAQVYIALHGKLPEKWFLSSTQYSAYHAWTQNFGTGYVTKWYEGYKARVLALRSFSD